MAAATGGRLIGPDTTIDGASIDSRSVRPDQLFVPIVAERDGHDFIGKAREAGVTTYLTSREAEGSGTAIVVRDTALALADLGRAARGRLAGPVVGVTGSVGKTSTKDLLASVLATSYVTAANERSFNNELGLPLTLLGARDDTEAVVVEMGARGVGHIALLCDIARPTVGIVTRVEGVHLELFGDIESVAQAKGELIEALPDDGLAVLNNDHPLVVAMADRTSATVLRYGFTPDADVYADNISLDDELRDETGLPVTIAEDPLTCVAIGTGLSHSEVPRTWSTPEVSSCTRRSEGTWADSGSHSLVCSRSTSASSSADGGESGVIRCTATCGTRSASSANQASGNGREHR